MTVTILLWIAVVLLAASTLLLLRWSLVLRDRLAIAVRERDFYVGLAVRLREASESRESPGPDTPDELRWATVRPGPESES